ncbi:MAG: hypothetical protein Q8P45_03555 [Candidatus Harrisonbacteria bacterium]|nr:hypothetical protein [Candidatus Harrisonbacteria bacterium]
MEMKFHQKRGIASRAGWTWIIAVFILLIAFAVLTGVKAVFSTIGLHKLGDILGPAFAAGLAIYLGIKFVADGFEELPTHPKPKAGIIKFFGKWVWDGFVGPGGLVWLPLRGILFSMEQVVVEAINIDYHFIPDDTDPEIVKSIEDRAAIRALDNSRLMVETHTTSYPSNLIMHELVGGTHYDEQDNLDVSKGVPNILHDILDQEIREWIRSTSYGPKTWEEAISASDDAVAVILEGLIDRGRQRLEKNLAAAKRKEEKRIKEMIRKQDEEIPELPKGAKDIPIDALMRYCATPQQKPLTLHKPLCGANWDKLRQKFSDEGVDEDKLRSAIEKRKAAITEMRSGNGSVEVYGLGITILRLNLSQIRLVGEMVYEVDRIAIENTQKKSGAIQNRFMIAEINKVMEKFKVSFEEAERAFFTAQRRKGEDQMKRTSAETLFNFGPTTRDVVKHVGESIGGKLAEKLPGSST